ncbi:13S globulin seed storage protein-like [Bidens hawaiensis]|uniref:13S globulin seed storage protein-like n=1 Tax=Bidens hawaiensis TaxID=980011 RepID=UPI00404B8D4C
MDTKMVVVKADETTFEGDGGGYYVWSNSKTPLLSDLKLDTGRLLLHPLGFAIPHYADSSKIGLVLHGTITVGLVPPNSSEEKILVIKKGDAIPVLDGVISCWFNGGATDADILFLGESGKALVPGRFTYFFLSGVLGFLGGFQSDFVGKTFGLDEKDSENLINSQQGSLLVKLDQGIKFPEPTNHTKGKLYATIDVPSGAVVVNCGGFVNYLTEKNLPVLNELRLSARFVKLEGNALLAPSYVANGSVQIYYVSKGSGRTKVVGSEGKPALDSNVEDGDLFVVPQFFATSVVADDCGMELFSVVTSSKPIFGQLAGSTLVWRALSPVVLQASLNVTSESEQLFKSKNAQNIIIFPPST